MLDKHDRNSASDHSHSAGLWLLWWVAITLHFATLWQADPLQSANDRSRWCTVWSLVERRTFVIDEIRQQPGWDSIDIVKLNDRTWSTKPPLLSVLAAGIYASGKFILGWDLLTQTRLTSGAVLSLVNLVPWAVALACWRGTVRRLAGHRDTQRVLFAAAAFGTLLTPFVCTLNNHLPAACLMFVCLWLMSPAWFSDELLIGYRAALIGACCGLMVCFELPALAWLVLVGYWLFRIEPQRFGSQFLPAAVVPLVGAVALNVIAFGDWRPPYARYGSAAYQFTEHGIPSYWMNPQGIDRNLDSPLVYAMHCLVGHHGLFSLTPLLALNLLLPWVLRRQRRPWAIAAAGVLALSIIVLGFYLTRTQNYNYGGVSCALRWMLWLVPLWLLTLVPVLDHFWRHRTVWLVAYLLLAIGMYSGWSRATTPWKQPWLFTWMEDRGWIDYRESVDPFPQPRYTWWNNIPAPTQSGPAPFLELECRDATGASRLCRITVVGQRPAPNERWTEVAISHQTAGHPAQQSKLWVDRERFAAGETPAKWVRWADANVTEAQQLADLAWLRGLPGLVEYRPGPIGWLRTPLRDNAYECRRAIAEVRKPAGPNEPDRIHRSDAWWSLESPFGVLQHELTVTDLSRKTVLHKERWTVRECLPVKQAP